MGINVLIPSKNLSRPFFRILASVTALPPYVAFDGPFRTCGNLSYKPPLLRILYLRSSPRPFRFYCALLMSRHMSFLLWHTFVLRFAILFFSALFSFSFFVGITANTLVQETTYYIGILVYLYLEKETHNNKHNKNITSNDICIIVACRRTTHICRQSVYSLAGRSTLLCTLTFVHCICAASALLFVFHS